MIVLNKTIPPNGWNIKNNGVSDQTVSFNRTLRERLIISQSDDRLNFTRATDLRSAYPWHAFEKAAVAANAGHVWRLYSPRKILLRMTDMPHVGKITGATLRKCPLWRNAYWWGDQSEQSRPTDMQLHPGAVNAQRQYTVTHKLNGNI